jgi:hypothetical protein
VLQSPGGATLDPALDAAAVRDTIARVFAQPGYDPSLRRSLGDRLFDWIHRQVAGVFDALTGMVDLRWLLIGAAIVVVALVLLRALVLAGSMRPHRARPRRGSARVDPWRAAEERAAGGDFTQAVHLLYAAVLETVAARHRVLLHPAKTTGDYERELRARESYSLPTFNAFARAYERAIWRERESTRADYVRLSQLARAVVHAGNDAAAA